LRQLQVIDVIAAMLPLASAITTVRPG